MNQKKPETTETQPTERELLAAQNNDPNRSRVMPDPPPTHEHLPAAEAADTIVDTDDQDELEAELDDAIEDGDAKPLHKSRHSRKK